MLTRKLQETIFHVEIHAFRDDAQFSREIWETDFGWRVVLSLTHLVVGRFRKGLGMLLFQIYFYFTKLKNAGHMCVD